MVYFKWFTGYNTGH
uniref:Uncharacterized protein n=1 Tax=Anguilla anguilla TaxID=7936 RepID=A0A0E9STM2_ANGAN